MSLIKKLFGNSNAQDPRIPLVARQQIVRIIVDATQTDYPAFTNRLQHAYTDLQSQLDSRYQTFNLGYLPGNLQLNILQFILESENIEGVVIAIEFLMGQITDIFMPKGNYTLGGAPKLNPHQAIIELNQTLRHSNSGYSFEGGKMIRVDSTLIHQEIIKPTISLLSNEKFKGANQEYMKAHEHWKNGNNKECLGFCLMAFESTLKTICDVKCWPYEKKATAGPLVEVCLKNNLFPSFEEPQLKTLKDILISGIPTTRNNTAAAHGQGQTILEPTRELTKYGLNLTGSSIIFLVEQSGIK